MRTLQTLQNICYFHLVTDYYSPETITLLPIHLREKLLSFLPPVDVLSLEDTPATQGVDMDRLWQILCINRLPTNIPILSPMLYSTKWRDHYFSVIFKIIVNLFGASHGLYLRTSELVHEFLFGFQNVTQISMKYSGGYFAPTYLYPDRYDTIEETLASPHSLAHYIIHDCQYRPSVLPISCSLFYYSPFFVEENPPKDEVSSTFRELVRDVSKLVVSSDDEAVRKLWSEDDDMQWRALEHFHLGAIYAIEAMLSSKIPKLESIVLTNCKSFLVSSFILSGEYLFSESISETHYLNSAACNLPYTHLREIVISLDSLEGVLSSHTPVALASIVESQISLEVLHLSKWPSHHCFSDPYDLESKDFLRLSSVVSKLFSRPQFSSLVLEHTDISNSDLYHLLYGLFNTQSEQEQCLLLDSVTIHNFIQKSFSELDCSNNCLSNTLPLQKKSLCLRNMTFVQSSKQVLLSYPLLRLKSLELDNVSPNIIDLLLNDSCPQVEELVLRNIEITEPISCNPVSVVLGSPNLKCLKITLPLVETSFLVDLIADGLLRNFTQTSLKQLDISSNEFGKVYDDKLKVLFEALFSLSCLSGLTLDISYNGFSLSQLDLACEIWKAKAQGVRMQKLICKDQNIGLDLEKLKTVTLCAEC